MAQPEQEIKLQLPDDLHREAPKHIRKRYGLYPNRAHPGLAWYLLDEYFKGNVTIKEDVQSK